MTSHTAEGYGRFMAGYCSNLPWIFPLIYTVYKPQWQVWHLFSKLLHRGVDKREKVEKSKASRNNNGDKLPYLPCIFCFRLR
jgi:hypothetical protein